MYASLSPGVIYKHWRDVPTDGWKERWPNFHPSEFASADNSEFYYHALTFDTIQRARTKKGSAIWLNSAHRSWLRNLAVGGVSQSAHLQIALDVSLKDEDPMFMYRLLRWAGFTSFGLYSTFIHCDLRPGRFWYGSQAAKTTWITLAREDKEKRAA